MATKEQLLQSMANRITRQFAEANTLSHNADFDKKEITLTCRNTRIITVMQFLPTETNRTGSLFYGYRFLTVTDPQHYTLEQLSEKLLLLGYENEDISGTAPDDLFKMGFVPEPGTNYCALSNMLMPDNYRLELSEKPVTGEPYEMTSGSGMLRDTFIREDLTVYGKAVAHRYIKIII